MNGIKQRLNVFKYFRERMNMRRVLKSVKTDLKKLRDMIKQDPYSGIDKSKELLSKLEEVKKDGQYLANKQLKINVDKMEDFLKLYLSNMDSLKKFDSKWSKDKKK